MHFLNKNSFYFAEKNGKIKKSFKIYRKNFRFFFTFSCNMTKQVRHRNTLLYAFRRKNDKKVTNTLVPQSIIAIYRLI